MGVEKFLDASTGYITCADSLKLLEAPDDFPGRVIPHKFGWWISVLLENTFEEEVIVAMRETGYSENFAGLMRLAHENNCWWINLDSDGGYVDGLESLNW